MGLRRSFDEFFDGEIAGGVVLMAAAVAALVVANSSLSGWYNGVLEAELAVTVNSAGLAKPFLLWVNDGLMAIFFFLIGLELKRELIEGRLKNPRDVVLPGMAAVGGMAVPAIIYAALNWGNAETIGGWAIPAATDIAFALGVLALVGDKVPVSLKTFLLTLAILDDLAAILIIAVFYTSDLHVDYLYLALLPIAGLWLQHARKAHRMAPSILLGVVLWVLVLKSGVHATIAGVVTAFFIPIKDRWGKSPLHALEDALSPYVLYLILPIFAFVNAGVNLTGVTFETFADPVTLGVMLGLVVGKQAGVFGISWLMVKTGMARMPPGTVWLHIYGLACLAGIGFTMSLFIGGLSFGNGAAMNEVRLGVLSGSVVSALLGFAALRVAQRKHAVVDQGAVVE